MALTRICDRCGVKKAKTIKITFFACQWLKGTDKQRTIIEDHSDFCESCLSNLLKTFGRMMRDFKNDARSTGPTAEVSPDSQGTDIVLSKARPDIRNPPGLDTHGKMRPQLPGPKNSGD